MTDYRHDIKKLAYTFWEERGRPWGSPEIDWFRAEKEIEQAARAWGLSETTNESESYEISEAVGHRSEEGRFKVAITWRGTSISRTF